MLLLRVQSVKTLIEHSSAIESHTVYSIQRRFLTMSTIYRFRGNGIKHCNNEIS